MVIRKDSTDEFEIDTSNWFMIVYLKKNKLEDESYTGAKRNRKIIIERIEELKEKNIPFKIYGVWHGEWKTDTFDLKPNKLIKILKKEIEQDEKEKSMRYKK